MELSGRQLGLSALALGRGHRAQRDRLAVGVYRVVHRSPEVVVVDGGGTGIRLGPVDRVEREAAEHHEPGPAIAPWSDGGVDPAPSFC